MEEMIASERREGGARTYFGKENFQLYYALGPELDEVNSNEFEDENMEEITSDFEEDAGDGNVDTKQTKSEDDLSDDSGTVEEKEWKSSSIPPDIIASANHLKVIKVEPKTKLNSKVIIDQDITDFRRHQAEAYTNLEDLLDEPWEESDFAPSTSVKSANSSGGDEQDLMKELGLHPNTHCVPVCNKCSIM